MEVWNTWQHTQTELRASYAATYISNTLSRSGGSSRCCLMVMHARPRVMHARPLMMHMC